MGAEPGAADAGFARLHGLHWLVANLAEREPVLLAVDDAHWADEPSLRFLNHLAYRLAGLPVLIAVTTRPAAEFDRPLLRSLVLAARSPVLRPRPLGEAAVAVLVRSKWDPSANDELCHACHDVSRGNPFLLTELLAELRLEAHSAESLDPDSVRRLAPGRVGAAVLMRIGRLDPDAPALARAIAVLGEQASLVATALLAQLAPARARALADALADVAVLEPGEPLRFVHPLVRTAIYQDIPSALRSELHTRAASAIAGLQAPVESVALHLLATHPAGKPDVVDALRAAASAATAPDTARALLRRALAEPPDAAQRPHVLLELARVEAQHWDGPGAGDLLEEAYGTTDDPVLRAQALILLGGHYWTRAPRLRAQIPRYESAAREVGTVSHELKLQLEVQRLGALILHPDLSPPFEDEVERFRGLPLRTPTECHLASFLARKALAAGDIADAATLAEHVAVQAAASGMIGWVRVNTTLCLVAAERYDVAERELTPIFRGAERSAQPKVLASVGWMRALVRYRRGDLRGAEADGRVGLQMRDLTAPLGVATSLAFLIQALIDQGREAEAEALVTEHQMDGELGRAVSSISPLIGRGRLRAATGRLAAARADLTQALDWIRASRWLQPDEHDARVALVPVLLALGDTAGATALAGEAVLRARRAGTPRALGGALRVAGLVHGGEQGLDLLHQAVDALTPSPSLLWRVEALVDLGAALRRAGRRTECRDPLRDGMDLAHRCGATPLADRAADELRALGHRIRRRATTGAEALTASERRVAELAAEGLTNKQIAQSLFVTVRTVETHLSGSYVKLAITTREELAAALG